MQLLNPNSVYTVLYEQITGRMVGPAKAATFLDSFFKTQDKGKAELLRSVWPKASK